VFYTPEYITKYIVDNTLGALCQVKKEELGLDEVDILIPKNPKKLNKGETKQKEALEAYRAYLLGLKILDPACGSGAFLNQALNYLLEEHDFIDESIKTLMGGSVLGLYDVKKGILENNLYGVDINAEAVEIAKLSLWLRTVESGRKLNKLADKIKVGNSLIDDKSVTNDAFVWEEEFSEVFEQGGFDCVIGNPPYGADLFGKEWLKNRFKETSFGDINSYKFFVQKAIELLNDNKILGFILPDSYLEKEYFQDVRVYMVDNFEGLTNIKLGDDVFDDVNMPTAIMLLSKKGYKAKGFNFLDISKSDTQTGLQNNNFINDIPDYKNTFILKNSIIKDINNKTLIDIYDQVMGVKVYQKGKGRPKQTAYEKDNDIFVSKNKFDKYNYQYISQGIERYYYDNKKEFIKYGEWLAEPRNKIYFDSEKIIIREVVNPRIFATYIQEPAVVKNIAAVIVERDTNFSIKYLLALINSKLFTFYVNEQSSKSSNKSYPSFNSRLIKNLPIKDISREDQNLFIEKADVMIGLSKTFQTKKTKFLNRITDNFDLEKLSKKLEVFYETDFKIFLKELKKKKATLTLKDQDEWEEYFETYQKELLELQSQIDTTDREIDAMVYALYGLSEDEIKVIDEQ
jgi:type I restriction-modification system DNA methylase subunit